MKSKAANSFVEDGRYAYATAYIRALENKLLSAQIMSQLMEVEDEQNLFKILQGGEYGVDSASAFEEKWREELTRIISLVKQLSLDLPLTKLLTMKYDFYNLKVLLKAKYSSKDAEPPLFDGGSLDVKELRLALLEGKMRSLPEGFADAIREAETEFEKTGELSAIDVVLDGQFANIFYRVSSEYGKRFFIEYLELFADLSNIKIFFRIHNQGKDRKFLERVLLDHGSLDKKVFSKPVEEFANELHTDFSHLVREGLDYRKTDASLIRLERLADEHLLQFLESTKHIVFGPEVLFAYLMVKENELKSIRTIVSGKVNGVPVDMIRERIALL
jgi:V/A-type H+-transporting ATPase subunit C